MSVPSIVFGFLPKFFYSQFLYTPPTPTQDCTGKTIIVTGANVGLGKEAAQHFVQLKAEKLILACRNVEKGEAAKKDIESTTKRTGVIEVWPLDLGNYESVKEFARRAKTLDRIDSVLENAGTFTEKFSLLEGNESTLTVNVISTFLLALLLLPRLREMNAKFGITPTVCIVSSDLQAVTAFPEHKAASIFDTMNNEKEARMSDRYNVSKLMEVLVCREIASKLLAKQTPVTINFVNPGFCQSELMREMSGVGQTIAKKVLARSTEEGSRVLVYASLAGTETQGKYLQNCKIDHCAPLVEGKKGPEIQKKVWTEVAAKLEEIQPGISSGLDG